MCSTHQICSEMAHTQLKRKQQDAVTCLSEKPAAAPNHRCQEGGRIQNECFKVKGQKKDPGLACTPASNSQQRRAGKGCAVHVHRLPCTHLCRAWST